MATKRKEKTSEGKGCKTESAGELLLEERFLRVGQALGYEGEQLAQYVDSKVAGRNDREDRAREREAVRTQQEHDRRMAELDAQTERSRLEAEQEPTTNSVNAEERPTPPRNRIMFPKYEERKATDIKEYLSLFQDFAQENRHSREEWLIHLRVAFSGSKLEKAFSGCASYDEAKREVLLAHGLTADKVWRDAKSTTQHDESFHHYVTRVERLLDSWIELTSTGNSVAEDNEAPDVLAVLVKQLALDGLPAEMKAFLIERKCFHMDMPTFQATGISYQEAHGRRKVAEKRSVTPPVQHSAQCLGVSAKQAKKDLAKMGKTYDRRAYVHNEKLCYLCLRGGHLAEQCQANSGCSKCDGKHHTLLHGKPKP